MNNRLLIKAKKFLALVALTVLDFGTKGRETENVLHIPMSFGLLTIQQAS